MWSTHKSTIFSAWALAGHGLCDLLYNFNRFKYKLTWYRKKPCCPQQTFSMAARWLFLKATFHKSGFIEKWMAFRNLKWLFQKKWL